MIKTHIKDIDHDSVFSQITESFLRADPHVMNYYTLKGGDRVIQYYGSRLAHLETSVGGRRVTIRISGNTASQLIANLERGTRRDVEAQDAP